MLYHGNSLYYWTHISTYLNYSLINILHFVLCIYICRFLKRKEKEKKKKQLAKQRSPVFIKNHKKQRYTEYLKIIKTTEKEIFKPQNNQENSRKTEKNQVVEREKITLSNLQAFPCISSHFNPFLAITSQFLAFPFPSISSYFPPFPAISVISTHF